MMTEKSKKWIEVGKLLAIDSTANVVCPECGLAKLYVEDKINKNNSTEIERLIFCMSCGARNYLRLKRD